MLDFYKVAVSAEDPSLREIRLGGLKMDELDDLFELSIASLESGQVNHISYFDDQYFSSSVVRDWLDLAKDAYQKAQDTPGYRSPGVEKFISFCQSAVESKLGLQTVCD